MYVHICTIVHVQYFVLIVFFSMQHLDKLILEKEPAICGPQQKETSGKPRVSESKKFVSHGCLNKQGLTHILFYPKTYPTCGLKM